MGRSDREAGTAPQAGNSGTDFKGNPRHSSGEGDILVLVEKVAPAAVPPPLAEGAIKAAVLTAAGKAAAGAIPATVAVLTKGVLRAMFLSKLKVVAAVVFCVMVAAGSVVYAQRALVDKPAAAGKDEAPKDEQKILGTWAVESAEVRGQKLPEEKLKVIKVTFTPEGKWSRKGDKEEEGTYKLDPAKNPKEVTITTNERDTELGIYKLDGDTLTVCLEANSNERPTEFATKVGSMVNLIVFKRVKK